MPPNVILAQPADLERITLADQPKVYAWEFLNGIYIYTYIYTYMYTYIYNIYNLTI